jgi:DNA polymerase III epsilon subunit-like protein
MRIFLDTETTDYWEFRRPPTDPTQPLPAQVAVVLETDTGKTVAALSALVAQDGWPYDDDPKRTRPLVRIDPRITELCGIDDDSVRAYGQNPTLLFNQLRLLFAAARLVVGHNVEFDVGVMQRWAAALHVPPIAMPETYCTMRSSTRIVGIQKPQGGLKFPKLAEAYAHFEKRPMSGAHDALSDVYASRRVYRGILRHEAGLAAPPGPVG